MQSPVSAGTLEATKDLSWLFSWKLAEGGAFVPLLKYFHTLLALLLRLRDNGFLRLWLLLLVESSEGGGRDLASWEAIFLFSSRRLRKESRISFRRLLFLQSMIFKTYLRNSKK